MPFSRPPQSTPSGQPDNQQWDRRSFLAASAGLPLALGSSRCATLRSQHWLEIPGSGVNVGVQEDLSFQTYDRDGQIIWRTSPRKKPLAVATGPGGGRRTFPLGQATQRTAETLSRGRHRGYRVRLRDFPDADAEIELLLVLDPDLDELLVQVRQTGGDTRIREIRHLYRFEKPTAEGGYLVVPHGSGYLVDARDPQTLKPQLDSSRRSDNVVGNRYTLPLFGMVKDRHTIYQIVETHWDCSVDVEHRPGEYSSLDFHWLASLNHLSYPRRMLIRFATDLDYVGMAKQCRRYVQQTGLFRTLREKARHTPATDRYLKGLEYRWVAWVPGQHRQAFTDLLQFRKRQLDINLFFPKWPSQGYQNTQTPWQADAGWQAFLQTNPVPGGWPALNSVARTAKDEGALVKVMINPNTNVEGTPLYDPSVAPVGEDGKPDPHRALSPYFGPEAVLQALNSLERHRFPLDALYFDGYAAHAGFKEDFSSRHPVTRRLSIEKQNACFELTRERGLMPGAELARFWCMPHCDFFFFTDWSADRLPLGEPVPLLQLVFHECYAACFSGGGYGRYDWPQTRNPRLYELLFTAAPGYNWMLPYAEDFPGLGLHGGVPIREWGSERQDRRIEWLRKWTSFYRSVAHAEMMVHRFLDPERRRHHVAFDNDVRADFDMQKGLCRVRGVSGFTGEWEKPHEGEL